MRSVLTTAFIAFCAAAALTPVARAAPAEPGAPGRPLRVAVVDFVGASEQDRSGADLADAVVAALAAEPGVVTVEREHLQRLLNEQKIALSALAGPWESIQVGRLASAQLVIAGRVSVRDGVTRVVARVISTETSRLVAVSVEASPGEPFAKLSNGLAKAVAARVKDTGPALVAAESLPDALAPLAEKLRGRKLPVVHVRIPEHHVDRPVPDPAAETEVLLCLQRAGVPVLDPVSGDPDAEAELLVTGEGVSTFAVRTGDLVTCLARLEWRARRPGSNRLESVGSQTARRADLAEPIAAKLALQDAGRAAALEILQHLDRTVPPAAAAPAPAPANP